MSNLDTLKQILAKPIWDGDLCSKSDRDDLVNCGYVDRAKGFNFITKAGIEVCYNLGFLKP